MDKNELKQKLLDLASQKDELLEQKIMYETNLKSIEKEIETLNESIQEMFGTTDIKELEKIKSELIKGAEKCLSSTDDNDEVDED